MINLHKNSGFTLIELMIGIMILAIILGFAVPSLSAFLKNNRLATAASDLSGDLAFARAEAARRGTRISLCISSDGTECLTDTSDWASGRITFVDSDASGTFEASKDELLRFSQPTDKQITAMASSFSDVHQLQFRPNGTINSDGSGNFKICDDRSGDFGKTVELLRTGRASVRPTAVTCP